MKSKDTSIRVSIEAYKKLKELKKSSGRPIKRIIDDLLK